MAGSQFGAALRQVRTLFDGPGTVAGLTDAQLFERFIADRDEAAFAALVGRHGPMVLAACRGVLRDRGDAEDAFQATFLILARKSRPLWARDSLACWLYTVARRVAAHANRDAARRREAERRAGAMAITTTAPVELDDRRRAVHEEIQRLPERYRAPILLCDLEELTRDEAAGQLGWRPGTVASRLSRGRELLRSRLVRRGVAPATGASAVLAACRAEAAVPEPLVGATIRAAMGIAAGRAATAGASSAAVALGERTMRALLMTQIKSAAACLAAVAGLIGVGAGSMRLSADGDGRPAIRPRTAPAPAARPAGPGPAAGTIPITGRIVDMEGRPIPGVSVKVGSIARAKGGDLTTWLEAARRGERPWVAYRHLEEDGRKPSGKAKTDAQGRFRLESMGAEGVAFLYIEGETVAHTQLQVVTRQIEPFPARGFGYDYGPSTVTIYGADFTLAAAPGRAVEGVVRDAEDRKAMRDVDVWSYRFAGSHTVGIMTLRTRTDGDGRFRLAGLPAGQGNRLLVMPNDDQPYLMREVDLPAPQGLGVIPVEVDLHRGVRIEGKLTDKETGSPVAGAFLHYLPFLDNKSAQAAPEFRGGSVNGSAHQQRYLSKSDGTFRLVGLPGRAIVGAVVYSGKPYRRGVGAESIRGMDEQGQFATAFNPIQANRLFPTSMKEINPAEGAETAHVDIELDPGAKVRLRVVDPQGKPVTGVKAAGRRDRDQRDAEPLDRSEFDVVTLGPGEDRLVLLVHEGRKLGRAIHVKEGDDKGGPAAVTLEPCASVTGRIVDRDGNPVSGATIECYPEQPDENFPIQLPTLATGPDGRFTVTDVPTGCGYTLVAEEARPGLGGDQLGFAKRDVTVRSGETTDLGEVPLGRRP